MDTTSCNWCFKTPATIGYTECKRDAYCSISCREKDAAVHKIICQGSKEFLKQNPRPLHLGLLPINQLSPRFAWLKFTQQKIGKLIHEHPDLSEYFAQNPNGSDIKLKNIVISCDTGNDKIEIVGAETKFSDGVEENKCLKNLMRGKEQYSWRGPIIILKRNGAETYTDLEGTDLLIVRKYFTERMSRKRKREGDEDLVCNFKHPKLNTSSGFKAVMISCAGDMKEFSHPKFSQVTINHPWPSKHLIFVFMSILEPLGLQLEFYQYNSGIFSNHWDKFQRGNPSQHFINPEIQNLALKIIISGNDIVLRSPLLKDRMWFLGQTERNFTHTMLKYCRALVKISLFPPSKSLSTNPTQRKSHRGACRQ